MRRSVHARLAYRAAGPARLDLQVAVAGPVLTEELSVLVDGVPASYVEVPGPVGGRHHLVDVGEGEVVVTYAATLDGPVDVPRVSQLEEIELGRPSRFCESDRLAGYADAELGNLTAAADLLPAVAAWVGTHLAYVPGSSGPTDGAVSTLLARQGVCRDFAHLTIALLRARGVPARLVAVYAPGLLPMDFHAVVEAAVDGIWRVVDPTALAPRPSLVRIATGRDAADTAFLTGTGADVALVEQEVSAVVDGDLPRDDGTGLVSIG